MARQVQPRQGVFVSYARKDGEAFATALRKRLEREVPHVPVWQDRTEIEGGIGWQKQIEEALERVEFLLIVMTPHAMQSEITRWEWRYARQQGVCVYPVKGVPDDRLDYESLPNWMRKVNFYDLEKEWEKFVAHLNRGCQATRVPFMAPPLTPGFVARPKEFNELLGLLLEKERKDPVAITTALTGAGGFGKTTLATALCHHDDVITAFDDGILWVTLGQTPNVVGELTRLYGALTGERPGFVSAEDAAVELEKKLETKNCLIVIDDVWDAGHLRPFLRGGPGCARLVTTRMRSVAAEAQRVDVDEMASDEAIALLTGRLEPKPHDLGPYLLLAKRLGEWPLLLKLAGSALREAIDAGDTSEGALKFVNDALDESGIAAFDRDNTEDRNQAVAATVAASLKLLPTDERNRCMELGIFPEDAEIPIRVIATLWGLNPVRARQLLQKLYGFSLIEVDLGKALVQLHDALRALFLAQLPDPQLIHRKLVSSWGDLYALPEPYAWRWIAHHLVEGGAKDKLRELLLDFAWVDIRLRATDVNSLLVDFDFLTEDHRLHLLRDALRLSAHVLGRDKSQLASQMWGRIQESELELRTRLRAWTNTLTYAWLRPFHPAFDAPGGPLIRTLEGHGGWVTAVAITPDGTRAVSAADDRTLKVWDLASGQTLRTLEGHAGSVFAVAITPNGQHAMSAARDRTLKVWDLASGQTLRTLEGHTDSVFAVAITPDGQHAVSAARDRTLKVWDLTSGKTLRTLEAQPSTVFVLAITADGQRAVTAADDRTLKVWDLASGQTLRTLEGHTGSVFAVAITPDGQRAVSAARDRTLKVFDLASGKTLGTLEGHTSWVYAVAITPDGQRAVSAAEDRTLKVWDLASGKTLRTLEGHSSPVRAVAITPDGQRVVSAAEDRTLKVWDLAGGKAPRTPEGHTGSVSAVAITPDGQRAVSSAGDSTLKVWDLTSGEMLRTFEGHTGSVNTVVITPEGQRVISAANDCTLKIWDLGSGGTLRTLEGHIDSVSAVVVTPDARRAVSSARDGTLKVWDLASGQTLRTLEGYTGSVNVVAITPDGQHAVSAARDGTLKVWNLADGTTLRALKGHTGWVYAVAITPDGQHAVTAADDRTLRLWDLASGRTLRTFEGHTSWVYAVAITPDGQRAVSAANDRTLKVWDLVSGRTLRTLEGHTGWVYAVAITADGQRAVSAATDRTLKVWDLQTYELTATFSADAGMRFAVAPNGITIVAGDDGGRVHFLRLENAHNAQVRQPARPFRR